MYDLVSGDECLKSSYYLNKDRALELFPMLKGDKLKGAIVYYDGNYDTDCTVLDVSSVHSIPIHRFTQRRQDVSVHRHDCSTHGHNGVQPHPRDLTHQGLQRPRDWCHHAG